MLTGPGVHRAVLAHRRGPHRHILRAGPLQQFIQRPPDPLDDRSGQVEGEEPASCFFGAPGGQPVQTQRHRRLAVLARRDHEALRHGEPGALRPGEGRGLAAGLGSTNSFGGEVQYGHGCLPPANPVHRS